MTDGERRLYQAWFRHYARGAEATLARVRDGRAGPAEALGEAMDAGVDVNAVLDQASADTERLRERAYRRASARRAPWRR